MAGLLTLFKAVCCPCSNWLVPIAIVLLYKILEYVLKIWNPLGIQVINIQIFDILHEEEGKGELFVFLQIGNKSEQNDATSDTEIEADECCSTSSPEKKEDLKKKE